MLVKGGCVNSFHLQFLQRFSCRGKKGDFGAGFFFERMQCQFFCYRCFSCAGAAGNDRKRSRERKADGPFLLVFNIGKGKCFVREPVADRFESSKSTASEEKITGYDERRVPAEPFDCFGGGFFEGNGGVAPSQSMQKFGKESIGIAVNFGKIGIYTFDSAPPGMCTTPSGSPRKKRKKAPLYAASKSAYL